jgi:hypothetical protein
LWPLTKDSQVSKCIQLQEIATVRERLQALSSLAESIRSCRYPEEIVRPLARELQYRIQRLGIVRSR